MVHIQSARGGRQIGIIGIRFVVESSLSNSSCPWEKSHDKVGGAAFEGDTSLKKHFIYVHQNHDLHERNWWLILDITCNLPNRK